MRILTRRWLAWDSNYIDRISDKLFGTIDVLPPNHNRSVPESHSTTACRLLNGRSNTPILRHVTDQNGAVAPAVHIDDTAFSITGNRNSSDIVRSQFRAECLTFSITQTLVRPVTSPATHPTEEPRIRGFRLANPVRHERSSPP